MDFLKQAQEYAEAHGHGLEFNHHYGMFRDEYSVRDSVWKTLSWLYGYDVADNVESDAHVHH